MYLDFAFILVLMSAVEGTYFSKAELVEGFKGCSPQLPKSSSCICLAADW